MSKRMQKQADIDIPESLIGRTYKLWSDRSDRDFRRWLSIQSYMSPLYRITYLVLSIILLLIGLALLLTGSLKDGVSFMAIGFGILLLIVLGGLIKI